MSMGPRGASVNLGARGAYANVGIPGTGISARNRIGGRSGRSSRSQNLNGLNVAFRLQDDGTVEIVAEDGSALSPRAVKMARDQNGKRLRVWLEEKCDHWNTGIDDLLGIHLSTPHPGQLPPDAARKAFSNPRPADPASQKADPSGAHSQEQATTHRASEFRGRGATCEGSRGLGNWACRP